MATVVTVMNMKGGVGKTTVTMHLGGMLSEEGRKVLMIDYDPQFNLSQAMLPTKTYFDLEAKHKTSLAILQDDETCINPFEIRTPGNNRPPGVAKLAHTLYHHVNGSRWDLIPSTLSLMYIAIGQPQSRIDPFMERFSRFIQECRSLYDLVLIDCHPAGSILTKTSLQNSDHVIAPVKPERYALRGVKLMKTFIDATRVGNQSPEFHILFNDTHPKHANFENQIRSDVHIKKYCLKHTLHHFKAFSDPDEGEGFVWGSGKPHSDRAYRNLVAVTSEIQQRLKLGVAT